MTAFAEIRAKRDRTPLRHITLGPEAFADDWQEKPVEGGSFALGLRKVSDTDTQTARAEAVKFAMLMHDDQDGQIEAFNDALMRWLVVRGTCDANDVTKNAELFDGSEENVRNALTSKAIRYIWDEIEKFHIETSPLVVAATDEQMAEFAAICARVELLEGMSTGAALRIRKFVAFSLEEMRNAEAALQQR